MAKQGSSPEFENNKVYLVKGLTLNGFVNEIRRNRVMVVKGGGLQIVSQGEDGTFLAAGGTIELTVCIDGAPVTKKFLLAE